MTITLAPLPADRPDLLEAINLPESQHQFASPPAISMAQATDRRDAHMIWEGDTPVGFFAIDLDYAQAHDFAEQGTLGLRMFCIDARHQGRGLATQACRASSVTACVWWVMSTPAQVPIRVLEAPSGATHSRWAVSTATYSPPRSSSTSISAITVTCPLSSVATGTEYRPPAVASAGQLAGAPVSCAV